jgi:hypothetical protein
MCILCWKTKQSPQLNRNHCYNFQRIPSHFLLFSHACFTMSHWLVGVEKDQLTLPTLCSMLLVEGVKSQSTVYRSALLHRQHWIAYTYDESLGDIVRPTFQSFVELIQWLHFCTESFCLSKIVCYFLPPWVDKVNTISEPTGSDKSHSAVKVLIHSRRLTVRRWPQTVTQNNVGLVKKRAMK